ncbi:MAG: SCO family protein [Verrucomicrobiota bacterium]
MAETPQQLPRTLWIGIVLLLVVLCMAYALSLMELNRIHQRAFPVLGHVAGFTLTNHDGQVTTLADLTNHVWVADIIFTRCDSVAFDKAAGLVRFRPSPPI